MLRREYLGESIEQVLQEEVNRIFAEVPYAKHLTNEDEDLNEHYYLRHRIETIWRIRMTSKTDALALFYMIEEDYDAARRWAHYTAQELSHDLLFMRDLRQHGLTDEEVSKVKPFTSTKEMVDYLMTMINTMGALPAVAYSLFVEWNSMRGSREVVDRAEKKYTESHVAGSKAHVSIDDKEDHYAMMVDIAHSLLTKDGKDEKDLLQLLQKIAGFFHAYFNDLYEQTITHANSEFHVTG